MHRNSGHDDRNRGRHRSPEQLRKKVKTEEKLSEWSGVLSPDDDVVFNLTFDWTKWRPFIMQVVFGRDGPLTNHQNAKEDLWNFVSRLLEKVAKQADQKAETYVISCPLKKLHAVPKKLNVAHRCRMVRGDDEFGDEFPEAEQKCLYYMIAMYLDFLEKQEFQKLKKLRKAQASLPVANYRNKILELVQQHSLVIISGDTGCGKSTQIPQYLLHAGYDKICCTQPRRIACISLSKRVAYETLNEYGSEVAYQIRFEKTKTAKTKIVFMTEGLLLRQMCGDPTLSQYNVLVLDEVHERHLHSDFLLGVVRCLIDQRADLKIMLMSATINIELFANYFNGAPVVQVPGRLYPIQVNYMPISSEGRSSSRMNPGPYIRVLQMIDNKYSSKERGDVLIFLSGINEITTLAEAAAEYAQKTRKWIVLQLHSSLSLKEQDKVFDIAPEGVRKCIIATNIAETSITIDGVRFVIDSGKVKEMSFDAKYHMQRLQEFWISQASAEQRRGRAGRTGPGVCYRMYQQSDYDAFNQYSTPEIQRVPLDSLILQMISMGLTEVRKFPFIEPPDASAIEQSIANLKSHGALSEAEELTELGTTLASLPLDVMIGKILISGLVLLPFLEPLLFIAAALTVQSPFTNRAFRDLESRNLLEKHFSPHGDSLTLLQTFNAWLEEKLKGMDSNDGARRWCRKRGVEEQRLYEITKLTRQFRDILQDHKLLNSKQVMEELQTERAARLGQVKQLRFLRRVAQRKKRGRHMLSLDDELNATSDAEKGEEDEIDLQDVEFQLKNEKSNIEEMMEATGNLSDIEIRIMKLLLCSGLYPNMAIPDEVNSYKAHHDQIYHTKSKPFVVMHPMSIFALQPELMMVNSEPVESPTVRRGNYSDAHQLVFYVSLLETNKPFVVNCLRVSALHSLLLFARRIDSNANCSRLLFDEWLEINFVDSEEALSAIEAAIWIRQLWRTILDTRLKASRTSATEVGVETSARLRANEKDLMAKLIDFVSYKVPFAVKRMLSGDAKHLYRTEFVSDDWTENPSSPAKIAEFLHYNSLSETMACDTACAWECQKCGEGFEATVKHRLLHWTTCISTIDATSAGMPVDDEQETKPVNPLAREYFCEACNKKFHLTPAEILKHRRLH